MSPPAAPDQGTPVACFDPANPLLGPGPCRLDTGITPLGNGMTAVVLTIRTPSTTTTVMLAPEELATWVQVLSALSAQAAGSGAGLARPSAADIAVLSRNGRRS